jgi:hypothetical protein
MKLPPEQIREIDRPDLQETFADSLGLSTFDGMTARITLCVQRLQDPQPAQPPMANKYPVCRLVLTPEAVVDLYNNLNQLMGILQKSGLINVEGGNPTVIGPKTIN